MGLSNLDSNDIEKALVITEILMKDIALILENADVFVPYVGAILDVNLGAQNFTTTGNIGGAILTMTSTGTFGGTGQSDLNKGLVVNSDKDGDALNDMNVHGENVDDINSTDASADSSVQMGGQILNSTLDNANRTLTNADFCIFSNSGDSTKTLPPIDVSGRMFIIANRGTGLVTVDADGTDKINNQLTQDLIQWASITLIATGANDWTIIART